MRPDEQHTLYRFYDDENRLLYIGITVNPAGRFGRHSDDKDWWASVARIAMQPFPDRASVLEAERRAIITERPKHNKQHNKRVIEVAATLVTPVERALSTPCEGCGEQVVAHGYFVVYGPELDNARHEWAVYKDAEHKRGQWVAVDLRALMALPQVKWHCLHAKCDVVEDRGDYWIPINQPVTAAEMLDHTLHLMGKQWLEVTDWTSFVGRILRSQPGR